MRNSIVLCGLSILAATSISGCASPVSFDVNPELLTLSNNQFKKQTGQELKYAESLQSLSGSIVVDASLSLDNGELRYWYLTAKKTRGELNLYEASKEISSYMKGFCERNKAGFERLIKAGNINQISITFSSYFDKPYSYVEHRDVCEVGK